MIELLDDWVESGAAYTAFMLLLTTLLYLSWRSGWLAQQVAGASSTDSDQLIAALYRGSQPVQTAGWHGLAGWEGEDWAAGCGAPLFAPLSGNVTANGLDGYVGPYSNGQQNTMLVIQSGEQEVVLLHGRYAIPVGSRVRQGVTPIGWESNIGNTRGVTGCHSHVTVRVNGRAVRWRE